MIKLAATPLALLKMFSFKMNLFLLRSAVSYSIMSLDPDDPFKDFLSFRRSDRHSSTLYIDKSMRE